MDNPIARFAVFLGLCLAVLCTWLSWPFAVPEAALVDSTQAVRGQYGDSFGALNTLFTGLAFAGVAFTVYLQIASERNREKERKQSEFEGRLFHFTDSLRSLISHMDVKNQADESSRAKDCFKGILMDVMRIAHDIHPGEDRPAKVVVEAYEAVYSRYQDDLGPYFRILYHIFRFIDKADIEEKEEYADFVRAELSSGELCLLEINGLTKRGAKFKRLMEVYNIAKHAPRGTEFDPQDAVSKEYQIQRAEG